MSKLLIIKGADFYNNRIDTVEPTPQHAVYKLFKRTYVPDTNTYGNSDIRKIYCEKDSEHAVTFNTAETDGHNYGPIKVPAGKTNIRCTCNSNYRVIIALCSSAMVLGGGTETAWGTDVSITTTPGTFLRVSVGKGSGHNEIFDSTDTDEAIDISLSFS